MEVEESVSAVFGGVEYLLTVACVRGDTLCVEAEQKSDGSRWRGDFTARYIEDITGKTGNFKKFSVFVRMLLSAMTEQSDAVCLDLLTYHDLELLKHRKSKGSFAPRRTAPPNNKRYLILTYAAEFDRVHYPLPLLFEENPDPEALKATIRRLRDELEEARRNSNTAPAGGRPSDGLESRKLREENERLRAQVLRMEEEAAAQTVAGDNVEWTQEKERAFRQLRKERDSLAAQLSEREAELVQTRAGRSREAEREKALLRQRLAAAEEDLLNERAVHKRALMKKSRECEEFAQEAARAKDVEKRLRQKALELTSELEALQRRHSRPPQRGRPEPSNPPRPGGRAYSPNASYGRAGASWGPSPGASSLNSSRGTSPVGSRGRQTPPPSRPNSAPSSRSFGRFDPTAYIREREKKFQRSRPNSADGRQTFGSHPADRVRPLRSPSLDRTDAGLRRRSKSPVGGFSGRQPLPRDDSHWRPTRGAETDRLRTRNSNGAAPAYYDEEDLPPVGRPTMQRSNSPGRALQEVKAKLAQYVNIPASTKQPPEEEEIPTTSLKEPPMEQVTQEQLSRSRSLNVSITSEKSGGKAAYDDAAAEIADIDSRLYALQNFLKAAKSNGTTS
eukprot:jgi/Chlat1/5946/Chrsp4S06418